MQTKPLNEIGSFYFQRFGQKQFQISSPIIQDTQLIIVIPCYDEAHFTYTLHSLQNCIPPKNPVELIVIVNASENASQAVQKQNLKTIGEIQIWIENDKPSWLHVYTIHADKLPRKHAGVGLARKIGMDEALRRFVSINYNGGIICLDADCKVAPNYLQVLEETFQGKTRSVGIYFEHQLDVSEDLQKGIQAYELFLRYYVQALQYSDYPYAMHTIGSSMGVRASIYALSGGMNRRKAGEDFYFMHKVCPFGNYQEIRNTVVYPSARISNRVPFGTGKAQQKWIENQELLTYHPDCFKDLQVLFSLTKKFYQAKPKQLRKMLQQLPDAICHFLEEVDFLNKVGEINAKSRHINTFIRHYFAWMDGLKVLQLVHFLRDELYSEVPIQEAARKLFFMKNKCEFLGNTLLELLVYYRKNDQILP